LGIFGAICSQKVQKWACLHGVGMFSKMVSKSTPNPEFHP
jgi:hypothetical protein